MGFLDKYYRAYREFWDKVSPLPQFKVRSQMVHEADKGEDTQNSSVESRAIDLDWVEAIEKALPSIDCAIRENRRFISVEEEIVPIEKSKRITTESVRHLAQHTNLIASVDDGMVTPESILNIRREESFAIYENRFLVLLLNTTMQFVEQRYKALSAVNDGTVAHINMSREFSNERETTHYSLEYYSEIRQRKDFNVYDNIENMSDYERVIRLHAILGAFSAAPLIRSLAGVEPIRPPITRTNLLMKNPYFRDCLELWVFIENYQKDGYHTIQEDKAGLMDGELKKHLEDAMDVIHFIIHEGVIPGRVEQLKQHFEEENECQARKLLEEEERRKEEEQRKIQNAVLAEREIQERKLSDLKNEMENKLEQAKREAVVALSQQKDYFESRMAQQQNEFEISIHQQRKEYEASVLEQKTKYGEQLIAEKELFQKQINLEKDDHKHIVEKLNEEHRNVVSNIRAEHQSKMNELVEKNYLIQSEMEVKQREELKRINQEHIAERDEILLDLRREKTNGFELLQQCHNLKDNCERLTKELTKEKKNTLHSLDSMNKLTVMYQKKTNQLIRNYDAKLLKKEKNANRRIENLERKLQIAQKKCPASETDELRL